TTPHHQCFPAPSRNIISYGAINAPQPPPETSCPTGLPLTRRPLQKLHALQGYQDTQPHPETLCPTGLPRHSAPSRNFMPYRASKTRRPLQKLHALQGYQDTQPHPETSCPYRASKTRRPHPETSCPTGLPRYADK
ncbi:unnamed protein product, partial [Staurois parvus]